MGHLEGFGASLEQGNLKLIIESDSQAIVAMLSQSIDSQFQNRPLSKICHSKNEEWEIQFIHTYCEGNMCADWLATWSQDRKLGLTILDTLPVELAGIHFRDLVGTSIPRILFSNHISYIPFF